MIGHQLLVNTCVVLKSKLPFLKGLSPLAHGWANENMKTNLKTYWRRINDGYSTMSDGILDGIFLVVQSQNISVKLFLRLLAPGFFLCSIEYLSWFKATINTTVCSSSLFSKDLEGEPVRVRLCNVFGLFCMCSSIFLENSRFYFPFLFTDCFNGVVPMILGTNFLNTFIPAWRRNWGNLIWHNQRRNVP